MNEKILENILRKTNKELMKEIVKAIKIGQDECNKQAQVMRMEMEQHFKREKQKWEEEKRELEKELKDVKEKLETIISNEERKERQKRRNNICIQGYKFKPNDHEKKEEVENFCKREMGIEVKVSTAFKIAEDKNGNDIVLTKFENYDDKVKVLKNKKELKKLSAKVYINNDLTKEQRRNNFVNRRRIKKEKFESFKVEKDTMANKLTSVLDDLEVFVKGMEKSAQCLHSTTSKSSQKHEKKK